MNLTRKNNGFTLIELLVAFSIIGIMSAYTFTVINGPRKHRQANEAVASENVSKLANSISIFRTAEGRFPTGSTDTALATYVQTWPDGSPVGYTYTYGTVGTGFALVASSPAYSGTCIKFISTVGGAPRSCTNCAINASC